MFRSVNLPRIFQHYVRSYYGNSKIDRNLNIAGPCKRFSDRMSIVGVPLSYGQPISGVEFGPEKLRESNLIEKLRDLLWDVNDCGDLEVQEVPDDTPYGKVKFPRTAGLANQKAFRRVHHEAMKGNVVLTIGGDHAVATGSVGGLLKARPEMCVIWVDAHADLNTPETTSSGNLHGMPVAQLMQIATCPSIPGFEWMAEVPKLQNNRLAYIGLRDVDSGERALLRELGIRAFSMHDVDKFGIGRVLSQALSYVNPMRNRPIHLSFDVDGVDPTVCPSTGTRVPGGLSFREAHYIAEELCTTGLLASMDIVEVNPMLGCATSSFTTVDFAKEIVLSAFGNLPL